MMLRLTAIGLIFFLVGCAGTSTPAKRYQLGLGLNSEFDFTTPIPKSPVFNKIHDSYLQDPSSNWSVFALMLFEHKYKWGRGSNATLLKNGISEDRAEYLREKEAWERVACEVNYIKKFADDPDMNTLAKGILADAVAGGDNSSYWKTFQLEEKRWIGRTSIGDIKPLPGKVAVAKRFYQIVEQLNLCINSIQEPVEIVRVPIK